MGWKPGSVITDITSRKLLSVSASSSLRWVNKQRDTLQGLQDPLKSVPVL